MKPLVSVVVPIYNSGKYLRRCLDSLIIQTYGSIEIILVNDGSTDSSPAICDEYAAKDSRIKVIHKSNAGVSEARNTGLDAATGIYIHFTDSDDWLESNAYEILVNVAEYKLCDVVRYNAYNSSNAVVNRVSYNGYYSGETLENDINLAYIGSEKFGGEFLLGVPWLYFIKRDLIEKNKIRFNKNLRRCEDRLFTLSTLLLTGSMVFIDDALYHYETSAGSLSNRYDPLRWEQELMYLDELKKFYTSVKSPQFAAKANLRIGNEYILRAIVSVNNEFFSDNKNSFSKRYIDTKNIIENRYVQEASRIVQTEKLGTKGRITLWMVRHRQAFLLSLLNSMILMKSKITK